MRMDRIKRFSLLLLIAFLAFSGNAIAADGKIIIAQSAEQRAVDAHKGGSTMFVNTSQIIYDTLIRRTPDGKIVPSIAKSWKSVSPTVLEFKLRKGVKFHNGEPLSADDVKFSLDRMRNPSIKCPFRTFVKTISEVKVINDLTVQVITKKQDHTLLNSLATYGYIVPKDYITKNGDQHFAKKPIGSGRYRFVKWVQSDYIELEAFPGYWGKPATVKTLIFKVIPENGARVAALQTGEIDIATNIPPFMVPQLKSNKRIKIISGPSGRVIFIGMSLLKGQGQGPLMKAKVRKALNYAINKESIVKHILMGSGRVLAGPVVPAAFGHDSSLKSYPYNPEKAKQLLAEAGYPNGFSTEFDTGSGRYLMDKQVAEAIVGMLGKINVKVKLNVLEWGQYVKKRRSHTQAPLYLLGWGNGTYDGSSALGSLFCMDCTHSNYSNPEVVKVVDAARLEEDPKKRKALYCKAQKMIYADAPWIFLYEQGSTYGVRKKVGNFKVTQGSETIRLDQLTIKK